MLADLKGQIERITYSNADTGYTVFQLNVYGEPENITVVGNMISPAPGEIVKLQGIWQNHPSYGKQFKLIHYQTTVPATVYGIEKYLGSGLIKGIGPKMAKRIVSCFGEETLNIIELDIQQLNKVEGIGKKRIVMIEKAWQEQKDIRDIMVFLQAHGVSCAFAIKIFKYYGAESISVVKDNPYRLATDISGIGFKTADKIAEHLGIEKNSPKRIFAGILFVMNTISDEGHVFYPYEILISKSIEILEVDQEGIEKGITDLVVEKKLIIEEFTESMENVHVNSKAVYLASFFFCETKIAERIHQVIQSPKTIRPIQTDKAISWLQDKLNIQLAQKQSEAIQNAISKKITIVNGKPGTGKTTIIKGMLEIFMAIHAKILLAAPTGRAAKRMSEATGAEAKTIHRLLEYSIAKKGFQKDEDNPLDCDVLIIDESSMIDIFLMYYLLKAVPLESTLIFVGDMHQLPSVGPGNVLKDMIESDMLPVIELDHIFRQASNSRIIVNAHKINNGIIPDLSVPPSDMQSDFYFIEKKEPEEILHAIIELMKNRIPKRFSFNPIDDIQVLTPMNKGLIGTINLNSELQKILNPDGMAIERGSRQFRINDKVMQIRNNYDKEVYNGDIGRITAINPEDHELCITFDNRQIIYDYADFDEIVLAYAVSVHKAQGSEFPAVIIPIHTQHYVLLQRNLIYTAVTRAKKLAVIVGTKKALAIGIKNNTILKRYTRLKFRISNF
ncbi:MAG: ATP-dependent RecD-like DNA helicase [Desulfobacterales bacterium]|nr:ATP-dependent RecD-like DNA helicase [Desulfobacterales bacterium]